MASTRETVLLALHGQLDAGTSFTIIRNEVVPQRMSGGILAILRDGDPGEPEVLFSPLTYEYEHEAQIELFADAADPDAAFDAAAMEIGAAILADRQLGGAVDWCEAGAPEAGEDIPIEGGATVKAAIIPVRLVYSTADPLT